MAETPTTREGLEDRLFDVEARVSDYPAIYRAHAILDAISAAGLAVVPREATDRVLQQTPSELDLARYLEPEERGAWGQRVLAKRAETYANDVAAADLLTKEE